MLTCRELVGFLNDYVDGDLEQGQRKAFEAHVEACPPCIEFLTSYRLAIELGKDACQCENDHLPEEVPEGIIKAILAVRGRR